MRCVVYVRCEMGYRSSIGGKHNDRTVKRKVERGYTTVGIYSLSVLGKAVCGRAG